MTLYKAIPWLRLFDTLLSPQRPFHVVFVPDNVAMVQVFF